MISGGKKAGLGDLISGPYPPATRGRVVLWGLLASYPFGGMTWQVLHYLVGLRRLGLDTWYVEEHDREFINPDDPARYESFTRNVSFVAAQMDRIGLGDRWIVRSPLDRDAYFGADKDVLRRVHADADAVINLTGSYLLKPEHAAIRRLIYVQTDPGATQVWVTQGMQWLIDQLDAYDALFTYGENLGGADCLLPIDRYRWHPTRAPICLDWWAAQHIQPKPSLTTVANWSQPGTEVELDGESYYWSKDREFRRLTRLAADAPVDLELTLSNISSKEKDEMRSHGWGIRNWTELINPDEYRRHIRHSLGEFSVAKDQNIRLRTGWFSDRSACYLASGRPVITQDTGFGNVLPTGEGLFAFSSQEEALAAIDEVVGDYERHSKAALSIADNYFDACAVLSDLLETARLI